MAPTPRVSVIVPAYDTAGSITQAIDSVVAGEFEDWQLIVCDDASRDGTADLVAAHPDRRVQLLRHAANAGPAVARNTALHEAVGELVAFLDSDDRWLPTFLSEQVRLFDAAGPGVGIVSCDAWLVDPSGRRVRRHSEVVGDASGIGLAELLEGNRVYVSAVCPRRVVEEVGGFSPECFGSEDHDLWLRIVERGYRLVHNPEPLALYSVGNQSVSSSRARMGRTDETTYRRALERGRLNVRQRRVARRRIEVARAVQAREAGRPAAATRALARAAGADPAGLAREVVRAVRRSRRA